MEQLWRKCIDAEKKTIRSIFLQLQTLSKEHIRKRMIVCAVAETENRKMQNDFSAHSGFFIKHHNGPMTYSFTLFQKTL